jgi:hypothetical protein
MVKVFDCCKKTPQCLGEVKSCIKCGVAYCALHWTALMVGAGGMLVCRECPAPDTQPVLPPEKDGGITEFILDAAKVIKLIGRQAWFLDEMRTKGWSAEKVEGFFISLEASCIPLFDRVEIKALETALGGKSDGDQNQKSGAD